MRALLILSSVFAMACTGQMMSPGGNPAEGSDAVALPDGGSPEPTNPDAAVADAGTGDGRTVNPGSLVNRAPVLQNFRVEPGQTAQVMFDSSEPIRASNVSGFVVSGRTVTAVNVVDGATVGHSFDTAEGFDYFDNNTIRYEGGADLEDLEGNSLHAFSLQHIENLIGEPESPDERFATATATGGGDGLSEATAWTLWEAASEAEAGQTVWVKAGRYTGREMYVAQSGTASRPIKFVGYKSTPGDITSMYYTYPDVPDSSEMPTIDEGLTTAGRNTHIRGSYLIFRNFQSMNINGRAFYSTNAPEGVIFDNSVAYNSWTPNGVGFQFNSRSGTRNRVTNSIAVNNSMSGIYIAGDFNLIDNCKVYSDGLNTVHGDMREGGNESNDYYAGFDGSHNVMRNVYAERVVDGIHSGHGLTLKSDDRVNEIFYNLIEDSTVVGSGTGLELRHDDVQYNVVRNVTFLPGNIPLSSDSAAGGITIRDGASHNRIENCRFLGVRYGIGFRDNTEEGAQPSGEHNVIANCVFEDLIHGIKAYRQNGLDGRVSHTTFINNTFVRAEFMYWDPRGLMGDGTNRVVNSVIYGVAERYAYGSNGFEESSNVYWMGYDAPAEGGNMSADPMFLDVDAGDFRLQTTSPVIDVGTDMAEVMYDVQGIERPQGGAYDLGAFEYYEGTSE